MYTDFYSDELAKKLAKLKRKDSERYAQVRRKMDAIIAEPGQGYKFLTHDMKGLNRVHLGHFVSCSA